MTQAEIFGQGAKLPLAASLFSIDGKLAVTLTALSSEGAVALVDAPPSAGSIALLVRNRVRVFCTIGWVEAGRLGLTFDDPLQGWRMEDFAQRTAAAPVMA